MILTILTVLISVGYSALNQNLSVSGEAFLRAKDNIRISRIELSDAANDGYETYNPEYSKRTTKMYTTLPKDDSSVTYTVKVTNSTGIRYKVGSIDVTSTNSNVSCTPSIEVNTILEDGITEFTVTANYENGMSQDTNLNACDIKYEFVPLDATPPTLAVQLVSDNGNTKTIKITAIDEAEGSGLSPDNIYKYYLSTSETELLGGIWKEYVNSTEFEISGDIEARYLWIYPVRDRAGNISGGNSSVEPYSVGKYIFIDDVPTLYNVIAKEALTDGVAKLYTGKHNDAYDESGTKKVFHFYGADDNKGAEVLTKNNVIFGGFCWQMIRTTDTGGTKLIYNGVPKEVDGKKVCTNSGSAVTIGNSAFASAYDSPAYAGYMYNTVYQDKSRYMTTQETILDGTYKLDASYWYGDSVSYDSSTGKYSLVNPYKVSSTDDYASLKGKYTFANSEQTYTDTTVEYIGAVSNTDYYKIVLSNGNMLNYYNSTYTYGASYTRNNDGTYTINNPTNIRRLDYYENYSILSGKYVCKNATNNTCSNIWYVASTNNKNFGWLTPTNEYMYANTFSYSNGEYTLDSDSSVMIWNVSNASEKTKLNNAHYTCFNKTGKCQTIYNINYLDSDNLMYYIELKNGKSLEDALNEMLYADDVNKTNSAMKNVIDAWYANNMTNYTKYLEDTVFCNDRTIADYGGWDSNGGNVSLGVITFTNGQGSNNEFLLKDNIYCANITDRFSVGNSKAKLTYPVGMISVNEMYLLGNDNARKSGANQWLMSPEVFNYTYIGYIRHRLLGDVGDNIWTAQSTRSFGVRPSVSLAANTMYVSGTGSTTDPYIVDFTAPTIEPELVTDGEREKTIKISVKDDGDLSSSNKYMYYLSTSKNELIGGEFTSYTPGEIFSITGKNETKYLWVYPVMDNTGNISGEKTDTNTPYIIATYEFKDLPPYLYNVIKKESLTGSGLAKLYTGEHNDAYDESGTENIYYFYGADNASAPSVLNKNNVLFAGFCWQMIRTTDTGGTKLIYNGVPKEQDGKKVCTNSGTEQQIGTSAFNEKMGSPAYVGYMYNTVYQYNIKVMSSTDVYKYANSFTYLNGTYKLSSDLISIDVTNSTEKEKLNNAHYTCFNTTGECEKIAYIYSSNDSAFYYIELQNGKSIEDALQEMLNADNVNQTNSTIKNTIDTWYQENMTSYTNYLEDTVFCNDRSIYDYGSFNSSGGSISSDLHFKNINFPTSNLYCTNVTDRFSTTNEKARLTYSVGLMSSPEMYLIGNDNIQKTEQIYWLSTPYIFNYSSALNHIVGTSGYVGDNGVYISYGVRPSVSLVTGTGYSSGTGTTTDPYVVDTGAPTVTLETLIDGEREKTVKIIVNDDLGLYDDNKYKYYLSTSATTLSGGEWKDYTSGEIFILAGENETKYLWVYPVMDSAWNINDNKTDVNTPYMLETITFKDRNTLYKVLQKEAASGSGLVKLYEGQHNDSYNDTGTQNIYHFYGADDTAATSILNKNNVLFGGFCWQMIRTTDTGGTKLIYNGVPKTVPTYLDKNGYNVTTNSSNSYTFNDDTNEWTNTIGSDTTTIAYTVVEAGNYSLIYDASDLDYTNMYFTFTVNDGIKVDYVPETIGSATGTVDLGYLSTTDVLKAIVTVDGLGVKDSDSTLKFKMKNSNSKDKYLCNNSGAEQQIGTSAFNTNSDSPAYVGYMYNAVYSYKNKSISSSDIYKYSKSFTYSNGIYMLSSDAISIDVTKSTERTKLNNAHYTCFNTIGECSTIYYIYFYHSRYGTLYYIELQNGKSVEDALSEMLYADNVNQTNSTIKDTIDTWYANNMTSYTKYLEDTVFCNDRSISDYGGWNPNDGDILSYDLLFRNFNDTNDLYCTNITDRFSVGNEKARLTYKVGLISAPEMNLLGNDSIRKTGQNYWLASPIYFSFYYGSSFSYSTYASAVDSSGFKRSDRALSMQVVRPAVSLKPNTEYSSGTGSTTDPYVIDTTN